MVHGTWHGFEGHGSIQLISERNLRMRHPVSDRRFAIFTQILRVFWCYLLDRSVLVPMLTAIKTLKGMTPYQEFWKSVYLDRVFKPDLGPSHLRM